MELTGYARKMYFLISGFGLEWTGTTRKEKLTGSQAIILYGFAILSVFLVVPLGVLGVIAANKGWKGFFADKP